MRRYEIFPSCVIFAVMKHAIELFSELGRRLERLGEDAASRKVIARACKANDWFTPSEVRRAAQLLDERASDADVERVSKSLNSLLLGIQNNDADQASLDDIETLLLRKALDRASGNVAAAARLLGITRPQMVYRLKSRGITHAGE